MIEHYSKEYNDKWDSYMYPESNTLKNKLGITDHDELAEAEARISFERIMELELNPIEGNFDEDHLRSIHKYIFKEVYDWAGEYRIILMQKPGCLFAPPEYIEYLLKEELISLNNDLPIVNDDFYTASLLAHHYIKLQHIHPFREGNSRTLREFFAEFIYARSNHKIKLIMKDLDREVMLTARKFTTLDTPGDIALEFYKALKGHNQTKTK